jgi:CheY-like chemotaxis protein
VLLDIKMPGLSGMEVLAHLIAQRPDISIIMMTAVIDTKTAVDAMKLGAYDYVTKPFDLGDLGMRVRRALERRRLLLENKEHQLRLEQKIEQQVEQIRHYYQEAVRALSREQMAIQELEAVRKTSPAGAVSDLEVGLESKKSSSGVEKFAQKSNGVSGAPEPGISMEEGVDGTSAQKETMSRINQEQPQSNKEKTNIEEALDLYSGTIELAILPPVSLQQVLQLHDDLRPITQMYVLNLGGSVDKGITIRVNVETPIPLLKLLRELPEVEKAYDEMEEPERIVPARQGESPKVRRIVVQLLKKPPANTIS